MFELFFGLLVTYLIYNVVIGSILALQYYSIEDEVRSDELLLLWFFPVKGLGKWKYNQILRWKEVPEYPADWYKYKYMMNLHWGFIAAFGLVAFIIISGADSMVGEGMKAAEETGHASAVGFGLLFDIGAGIFEGLLLIIALLGFGIMTLVFIYYPRNKMRKIEAHAYRQKYHDLLRDSKRNNPT